MPSKTPSHRRAVRVAPVPAFFLYGEPPQAPDERTVHVETIAARSQRHDWTIAPHRHRDLHQLLLLQSGRVDARIDDKTLSARAPCMVIVPPNVVHGFHFETDTQGLVTTFAAGLAKDVVGPSSALRKFLDEPRFVAFSRRNLEATDLDDLAAMVLLEFERSADGRDLALRGLLAVLIANVYRIGRREEALQSTLGARDRELVSRFREAIERSFAAHRSVGDYCVELGVSESRLRRACLGIANQPPVSFIHLRLLVEAERQLRYTAMPVTQIAYLLGFEDPAYFTRFFRQRIGMSPKAFRARPA